MPTFLHGHLTQMMPKILEPRNEDLKFENGYLIPTVADLMPGAREVAYERYSDWGDASIFGDGATNIPVVEIQLDEDRYPTFAIGSGFPVSFQEERAMESMTGFMRRTSLDRFAARMSATRKVISQRINRLIAYGRPQLGFQGFVNNALISPTVVTTGPGSAAGSSSLGQASYSQLCEFFVDQIESITDNFASREPTQMLISSTLHRRLRVQSTNGDQSVRSFLREEFPNLDIEKVREVGNASLVQNGVTSVGDRDRIILYPKTQEVVHRHMEASIAELLPEDYIRIDGMRRIYPMASFVTPAIIDYPLDVRYVDVFTV